MAELVERYVLFDSVGWSTEIKGRPDRRDYWVGRKGELISLPLEEAERLDKLGATSASAVDMTAAEARTSEPPSWSDEQLASASVDDTVAYLAQHPSEAGRVVTAETASKKPRKTLIEAAERVQVTYQEELAAQAEQLAEADAAEQRAFEASQGAVPSAPRIP